jgi:hypothetical protein
MESHGTPSVRGIGENVGNLNRQKSRRAAARGTTSRWGCDRRDTRRVGHITDACDRRGQLEARRTGRRSCRPGTAERRNVHSETGWPGLQELVAGWSCWSLGDAGCNYAGIGVRLESALRAVPLDSLGRWRAVLSHASRHPVFILPLSWPSCLAVDVPAVPQFRQLSLTLAGITFGQVR